MEFEQLLEIVGDEPVFETGLLLAGDIDPAQVYLQISRWNSSGRIYQIRRGVYALAPPFQKVKPHPFLVANRMRGASYVSCQSALAHFGLIPEYVPVTVSVTTARSARWETHLGACLFQHIKPELFHGYERIRVAERQHAFVALPEKALLDLVHLTPGGASPAYLQELRLQNTAGLDANRLHRLAEKSGSPKLARAADFIADEILPQEREYQPL